VLQPNKACQVYLEFNPASRGTITGTLRFYDDSGNQPGSTQDVSLIGTGIGSLATINPADRIDFSRVLSGTTALRTITITNTGDPGTKLTLIRPVYIDTSTTSAFTQTVTSTTCPVDQNVKTGLDVGASCTITVAFTPNARQFFASKLDIVTNANGTATTYELQLQGRGIAPELGISPANGLDFSDVVSGTTKTLTATISNVGDSGTTLNITPAIVISPTSGGAFTQTNDCAGAALVAGGSGQTCTITATFAPKATGPQTVTLSIPSNADALASTLPYRLTGAGVAPHAAVNLGDPAQALPQLSFGTAQVGQAVTRTVYITNTGSGVLSLTVTKISLQGPKGSNLAGSPSGMFTIVSQTCFGRSSTGTLTTLALGPGQGCAVTLQFKPSTSKPGPQSATLTIVDNSEAVPGSVQTVDLSGTGSRLTVTPIGRRGQVVVTGAGFQPGETVDILYNCTTAMCTSPLATRLGTTMTNNSGYFTVQQTSPSTTRRTCSMAARGNKGTFAATFYNCTYYK